MTTSNPNQRTSKTTPAPTNPALISAVEATWAAIRRRHPDVPEVMVTLAAGHPYLISRFVVTWPGPAADIRY